MISALQGTEHRISLPTIVKKKCGADATLKLLENQMATNPDGGTGWASHIKESKHPQMVIFLGVFRCVFRRVCRFTADIAVLVRHVLVDIRRVTDGHAEPAKMGRADRTLHVVAAVGFLNWGLAFRTRFSLVVGHPLLQGQRALGGQVTVFVAG